MPHRLTPEITNTYWVNLIGRGYPYPRRDFRWCTDRMKIDTSNRFIKKVLQSQAVAKLGQLKYQAEKHQLHLKDYDLQIFRELDFFRIQGDELMMGSTERRQLETSPTYAGLCAEKDALLDVYQNSLRIACARIQSLRKR